MGKELRRFEPNALKARSKDPPCFALKLPAPYLESEASPWSRYAVVCWDICEGVMWVCPGIRYFSDPDTQSQASRVLHVSYGPDATEWAVRVADKPCNIHDLLRKSHDERAHVRLWRTGCRTDTWPPSPAPRAPPAGPKGGQSPGSASPKRRPSARR